MPSGQAKAKDLIRALLLTRAPAATVCPSEVARQLATVQGQPGWRALMPEVHAAVDALVAEGTVTLTWKGKRLDARAGPYRIGRRDRIPPGD